MRARPVLMLYCQHSLGMGHLVRSFALAQSLARAFRVLFINGGPLPRGLRPPDAVELVDLPPLGMGEDSQLISRDPRYTVAEAKALRRHRLLQLLGLHRPAVLLIELFPFGRKKFAYELLPLLEGARALDARRPLVFCSLRDILVGSRRDQQRHDDRAARTVNRHFDAVLVHADPRFARLEETFHPSIALQAPVLHTGFVSLDATPVQATCQGGGVLVSAGGGIVGMPLFLAALGAQPVLWREDRLPMTLVAGPFLPGPDWERLQALAAGREGLTLLRCVSDMRSELARHALSVSQCGYNTTMDLLACATRALVVPYAAGREDEQRNRAHRLEDLGLIRTLDPQRLDSGVLLGAIRALRGFSPRRCALDTDGARHTTELIAHWSRAERPEAGAARGAFAP